MGSGTRDRSKSFKHHGCIAGQHRIDRGLTLWPLAVSRRRLLGVPRPIRRAPTRMGLVFWRRGRVDTGVVHRPAVSPPSREANTGSSRKGALDDENVRP